MKSSRESDLDYGTHEAKGQTSAERGKEEEGVSPDTDDNKAEGQTAEEKPGGDYPDKPGPGLEPVSGTDGLEEPEPAVKTLGIPSSAVGEPAVESKVLDYPECSAAKTSQRWRPKLSRMDRVKSSSSSSSAEEERISQTHRWVLLKYR